MSVPSDALSQFGMFLQNNPLLLQGLGIASASGPSRMPTSLGQVAATGMGTANELQMQNLQRQQEQLGLAQQQAFWKMMQPALTGQPGQPSAPDSTPGAAALTAGQSPLQGNPLQSGPQPIPGNPLTPPVPNNAASAPGITPQTALRDPTQDPRYQGLMQRAMLMDYFKPGSGDSYRSQAQALLNEMQNEQATLTPDEVKSFVSKGGEPGVTYQYSPYTGKLTTVGEPAIKTIQVMTPRGTMATVPYDVRTGQINDVGGVLANTDYSQPLKSAYLENLAQRFAKYQAPATAVSSRDPGVADAIARADYLNRDIGGFDQTTYPMKLKASQSLAAGKDYQQNSAYSTVQTHMQTLDDAMAALNNGDVQGANKLTQWAGKQFGSAPAQNAKVVNDIVVGELARVLAQGGQVTDSVRNEASGMLEPYLSKGQYQGATNYIRQLIAGKMNTSYINARANNIPDDVFMSHLSPEARTQLVQFRATHPDQFSGAQAGAPSGNDPLGIR